MSKKLLAVLAAGVLLIAGCGDDDGGSGTTTTGAPDETTTSTTGLEELSLDDWVEAADEICADTQDILDEIQEGAPDDDADPDEIQEYLEAILEAAVDQDDALEALGLPDEEADAVETGLEILREREEMVQEAIDLVADGDLDEAMELLSGDGPREDELREATETLGLEVCGGGSAEPDEPMAYGDDDELDALWDDCDAGDPEACDDLYFQSPIGSEYEAFGETCGDRADAGEDCSEVLDGDGPSGDVPVTGDALIDELLLACAEGNGVACDQAYAVTDVGSDAEAFADTCGGLESGGTFCATMGGTKIEMDSTTGTSYGDDPQFDAMQDDCADGNMPRCDLLYLLSPIGSDYERFGGTCGETYGLDDSPWSCSAGE